MAHAEDCMCGPCLDADFNAHVIETFGEDVLGRVLADSSDMRGTGSVRTRYAKPGQSLGNGKRVRKVSDKQVKYIKFLLASRDTSTVTRLPGSEDIENMSLRGARDFIERLLKCPETDAKHDEPLATEKQIAYARSLATRKGADTEDYASMTRREISTAIDALKAMPDAPREETPELAQGMYRKDGEIYKVQRADRGAGNLYAKRLVREDGEAYFTYAPGIVRKLTEADRMSLDEAREYGALYGICCACSRTLTDEESIANGIGPVCASKHFS